MNVKFAHVSDCHLGAWRKDTLNDIGYAAYNKMIDTVIEEEVDFVIISGDLFHVSNPKVDVVDLAIIGLKRLADNNIPVYGIMGSHDFSPTGKSMLRPLISADLFKKLYRGTLENNKLTLVFTEDEKTKIKLTGIRARKRTLELRDYEVLDRQTLEQEEGIKIFVLHTLLSELKPIEFKDMRSGPKSILPRNFLYYAGGHIHKTIPEKLREESIVIKPNSSLEKKVIYPGSLYPTNFYELEQFQYGGFCIVSGEIPKGDLKVKFIPIKIKEVEDLFINAENKSVEKVNEHIDERILNGNFDDKIVTVRIAGELATGKPINIKPDAIKTKLKEKGAYEVFINKSKLKSKEYEKVKINPNITNEEIEKKLIHQHAQKSKIHNLSKTEVENKIYELFSSLGRDKNEGETVKDYDMQMIKDFYSILNIDTEEVDE